MQLKSFEPLLRAASLTICAAAVISGCALQNAAVQPVVAPPTHAAIKYEAADASQRMKQAGLLEPFVGYWDAHVSRDWARMYKYEVSNLPLSLEFYAPYHARAWSVLHIDVIKLDIGDAEASLRLGIRVEDPKSKKTSVLYREDKWSQIEGAWRHRVTDPLLTVQQ